MLFTPDPSEVIALVVLVAALIGTIFYFSWWTRFYNRHYRNAEKAAGLPEGTLNQAGFVSGNPNTLSGAIVTAYTSVEFGQAHPYWVSVGLLILTIAAWFGHLPWFAAGLALIALTALGGRGLLAVSGSSKNAVRAIQWLGTVLILIAIVSLLIQVAALRAP